MESVQINLLTSPWGEVPNFSKYQFTLVANVRSQILFPGIIKADSTTFPDHAEHRLGGVTIRLSRAPVLSRDWLPGAPVPFFCASCCIYRLFDLNVDKSIRCMELLLDHGDAGLIVRSVPSGKFRSFFEIFARFLSFHV